MFRDNVKARQLQPDGTYRRRVAVEGEAPYRVQQVLQEEALRAAQLAREGAGVAFHPDQRARPRRAVDVSSAKEGAKEGV